MLTAALLEEKKLSLKKQTSNRKESHCSSASISPECSIGQQSVMSRSPSPHRKFNFQKNGESTKQTTFKYIVNSRTPSPILNTRPLNNTNSESSCNNNSSVGQLDMKINDLRQVLPPSVPLVRKQLPPTPVNASRDEYELKNLINHSMNQLKISNPKFYHQTFSITNNPISNVNKNNNNANDSDENEDIC